MCAVRGSISISGGGEAQLQKTRNLNSESEEEELREGRTLNEFATMYRC